MNKYRNLSVEYGTGLRKQFAYRDFKGSINEFLESIKKYDCKYIQVFERVDSDFILLWSKDKKGLLQQVEQMELF
ncbi:hypothetical protein [Macrococcus armenti]|uniref:hypothetical protein n=1 Tax=Macrococcus armenti TaxID=2875764 RepID=UPI001CD34F7B|nr:hypothetical protein [Macrococcus armenti]UBH10101.1 hypothetical protein LAU38_07385 [Macrococcus armenti]